MSAIQEAESALRAAAIAYARLYDRFTATYVSSGQMFKRPLNPETAIACGECTAALHALEDAAHALNKAVGAEEMR
jgi:hypothetical protein